MKTDNALLNEALDGLPDRNEQDRVEENQANIFVDIFEESDDVFAQDGTIDGQVGDRDVWLEQINKPNEEGELADLESWELNEQSQDGHDEISFEDLNMDDFWTSL